MITKKAGKFECKCDVCGASESVDARDHAGAWEAIKNRAWTVRHKAFPIVHVCHECPVEVSHAKT